MSKNNISLITVSFKQGFISPNVPIATFYQEDKKINLLLDTGSDNNVIDQEALKQFKHTIKEDAKKQQITGVGGVQSEALTTTISFSLNDKAYSTDFLVTDLSAAFDLIEAEHCITIHGILGSRFLREHGLVLDFQNLVAYNREG